MDTEVKTAPHTLRERRANGKIAIPRKARKGSKCDQCGLPIEKGTDYYCVYFGGAGLGDIKFPDRVHEECINDHLKP